MAPFSHPSDMNTVQTVVSLWVYNIHTRIRAAVRLVKNILLCGNFLIIILFFDGFIYTYMYTLARQNMIAYDLILEQILNAFVKVSCSRNSFIIVSVRVLFCASKSL